MKPSILGINIRMSMLIMTFKKHYDMRNVEEGPGPGFEPGTSGFLRRVHSPALCQLSYPGHAMGLVAWGLHRLDGS